MQSANLPLPGCEGKASLRCGEATAAASQNPSSKYPNAEKDQSERIGLFLVGEDGFEPSKRNAADLQSVPFGHSGTPPNVQLVVPANFDIIARIWDLSIGFYVILRIIFGKFQAQRRKNRLRYGVGQGRADSFAFSQIGLQRQCVPTDCGGNPTDRFACLRASHGRANSPPDCLLGPAFRIHPPNTQTQKKTNPKGLVFFCLWATKKIFSAFLRMNSNSYQKILSFQI